ncbi:MAG: TatD family hydrolase [Bacilli bacterium]
MNNFFVDTHAHLFKEYFSDIDEIIDNAKQNNVNYIVNSGCDDKTNKEVMESIKNNHIFGTIGIHPEAVLSYKLEDIQFIKDNINNKKIIAVGEIGLDYHFNKDQKEEQKTLFETMLKIAEDNNLPVVIHSRDATEDTINILKKYKVKGVIHSFSGSLEVANIYINMGYMLGINGVSTFKNTNLLETLKNIDISNIVLETDTPYLTPVPYRGMKNEPKNIIEIAKNLSLFLGISLNDLAEVTNKNISKIFDKIVI